jgi:two-component system response regulator AtoC
MRPWKILIADDEPLFGETTARFLELAGYTVEFVEDAHKAEKVLAGTSFDLVIADLDMPGNRELEFLSQCRSHYPEIPLVVVTGRPSMPSAIEGIRLGIHDYFLKPLDLDDLLHSLDRALRQHSLAASECSAFENILGISSRVTELRKLAARVARSQATVLIRGESGTGKELLARGIHESSQRRDGPFVTVDCASIPDTLVESILFGHVKGAFTGAHAERIGLVKAADRGTLFLDEVGELPPLMQSKLLRVLQFGTFLPVGGTEECRVDARIVAATNRDIKAQTSSGDFRLDLYYRLAVLEIVSPPLRQRRDDIEMLANHFLEVIVQRDRYPRVVLSQGAVGALLEHSWPGNIRELANTIERCICNSDGHAITLQDVKAALQSIDVQLREFESVGSVESVATSSREALQASSEIAFFVRLLEHNKGNISQAARQANMSRQGLHKALQRLGIKADGFRRNN